MIGRCAVMATLRGTHHRAVDNTTAGGEGGRSVSDAVRAMPEPSGPRPHGYVLGIVHYRDRAAVRQLVEQSRGWSLPPARILVVDNSLDLPAADLVGPGAVPEIISPPRNLGYAGAANLLLDATATDPAHYLLLTTQDCRLDSAAAAELVAAAATDPLVAVAAPELYFFSRPDTVFSLGGVITRWSRTIHLGQGIRRPAGATEQTHRVDWADGCCLLIDTAAAAEVGNFDERYFLYVEEVDFAYRMRRAGRSVVVVPHAIGYQEPGNYTLYYKYRNLMFWTSQHGSLRPWPCLIAWPKDSLRMLRLGRPAQPLWAVRGMVDFLRGRLGPAPERLWSA